MILTTLPDYLIQSNAERISEAQRKILLRIQYVSTNWVEAARTLDTCMYARCENMQSSSFFHCKTPTVRGGVEGGGWEHA